MKVDGLVRLDNWINFKMNPNQAVTIAALRPVLEKLIDDATQNPDQCLELNETDNKVNYQMCI